LAIDAAWDFKKEFFILVPVLGSALAVIFDVGYFTAIGLNWFSVFSTTDTQRLLCRFYLSHGHLRPVLSSECFSDLGKE
jgi:hypothetical protein